MLKIIDAYKEQLRSSEQEIKRLQNIVLNSDKNHPNTHESHIRVKDLH